ncbi:heavy-metal-associated domain-containing protein [Pseudanabaena sp. PCC 6802]|uniref:heavy-metal-associated domain-containing protein n=1 Tax=Pseudanabaena sp. PCC 6802 TaxID=118173 RepID=UPI00035F13B9|nr:heavy-metal-associated domain-containing protein [Pseudanabaena sp. PCC 6802]
MSTIELKIPSMACSACADTITKAVKALDASATIQADLTTKLVSITTTQAESEVKGAIAAAGYAVDG